MTEGWQVLPLGCGGLVTGFDIADDGVMYCRTDVGNCYRFSNKANITDPNERWQALFSAASVPEGANARLRGTPGGWEIAVAPSNSNVVYCVFPDCDASVSISGKFVLYRSLNAGATWTKTNVTYTTADSNTTDGSKNASGKIIIDPNNPDIVYAGMSTNGGGSWAVYRTLDGGATDFVHVENWPLPPTTMSPAVAGMAFDRSSGTVVVSGQTRTARILIPVTGVGIFESTDGGQTWTDTTPNGIGTIACGGYQGKFTNTGIYYGQLQTSSWNGASHTARGYLWRYKSGVWEQLDSATSTFAGLKQTMVPCVFVGSVSGTTLTVESITSGALAIGRRIYNGATSLGTISGGSGSTWTLNNSATVASGTPLAALNATAGYASMGQPMIDQRPGEDGYLTISGPNGNGIGYTSTNADQALASITWGGATGTQVCNLSIPSYEPGWFADLPHGTGIFLGGTQVIIDSDGTAWWSGHQAFWHYTARPNFSTVPGRTTTSVSTGRGMECVISQDVIMPAGCPAPIMGSQDVGVHRGTYTSFPEHAYPTGGRPQCQSLDWSPTDPSLVFAKEDNYGAAASLILSDTAGLSAYSTSYGETGSWTKYPVQPVFSYQSIFTGNIQNGIGGLTGSTLTVSAMTQGNVVQGQEVLLGADASGASRGFITQQLTGTPTQTGTYAIGLAPRTFTGTISNDAGGTGDILNATVNQGGPAFVIGQPIYSYVQVTPTESAWTFLGEIIAFTTGTGGSGKYQLSQSSNWSSRTMYSYPITTATTSQAMAAITNTQGGPITAVDSDHQIVVPSGLTPPPGFVPVYTTDRGNSWSFTNLPSLVWTRRSHFSGGTPKIFAAGYGSQVGTVWAVACFEYNLSTFYKSTDYGATWSPVSTLSVGAGGNFTTPFLFTVPGYPDHLWFTCTFTGGGGEKRLWRSTDGGVNWSVCNLPPGAGALPRLLCLGAPQSPGNYPTVFLEIWFSDNPGSAQPKLYYCQNGNAASPTGLTWVVHGNTGTNADMVGPGAITRKQSIHGDWGTFKQLHAAISNMGYASYLADTAPNPVVPLRLRLKA